MEKIIRELQNCNSMSYFYVRKDKKYKWLAHQKQFQRSQEFFVCWFGFGSLFCFWPTSGYTHDLLLDLYLGMTSGKHYKGTEGCQKSILSQSHARQAPYCIITLALNSVLMSLFPLNNNTNSDNNNNNNKGSK